jgi:hypothetical protein
MIKNQQLLTKIKKMFLKSWDQKSNIKWKKTSQGEENRKWHCKSKQQYIKWKIMKGRPQSVVGNEHSAG